jgi:LysM repeat protein
MHRVAPGETLAAIGKRYGTSAGSIVAANNLQSAEPVEGDRLIIPAAVRTESPAAKRPVGRSGSRTARTVQSRRTTVSKNKPSAAPSRKAPIILAHTSK